jgi:hypothetical protein
MFQVQDLDICSEQQQESLSMHHLHHQSLYRIILLDLILVFIHICHWMRPQTRNQVIDSIITWKAWPAVLRVL